MAGNTPTIVERFLDSTGLTTLWEKISNKIASAINELRGELSENITKNTQDITKNTENIETIFDNLQNYRGYEVITLDTTTYTHSLNPNTYYKLTTNANTYTISFNDYNSNSITNEYVIEIICNSTPTLNFPAFTWANEMDPPALTAGKKYIISIINGCGVYGEY